MLSKNVFLQGIFSFSGQGLSTPELIDESLTRDEMLSLIAATDCYVSLHRAEGFGCPPGRS